MVRFILPIILIGISASLFFMFSNPIYSDIGKLRDQVKSYDTALSNSKELLNQRDQLTTKKNKIDPDDLIKLQRLLPENIDNIRLILEIEQIASPYGMVLKDIEYSPTDAKKTEAKKESGAAAGPVPGGQTQSNKGYGVWDLEFSTTGTYDNFINFTRDLEKNLRIVDISSVDFSSNNETEEKEKKTGGTSLPETYKYNFKVKTYWLKN